MIQSLGERMRLMNWLGLRPWRRHSLVLAVAGSVYVLVGVVYIITPTRPDRAAALALLLHYAPIQVWGIIWVLSGVLALISTRWPPPNETWGYTVLASISALWAATYGLSIVFFDAPASGISGVLAWGLFGFMWWAISGLRNPDDVPRGSVVA